MKKKNNMLTIILIALVAVILVGVMVVILLTQWNKGSEEAEPSIDEVLEASVDVEEITTNLADNHFVKIQFKIETESKEAAEELLKRDYLTRNIVIQELSEMKKEDLEGKQGKVALQNTIKTQINELMQEGQIQQVYITSYIIQ